MVCGRFVSVFDGSLYRLLMLESFERLFMFDCTTVETAVLFVFLET